MHGLLIATVLFAASDNDHVSVRLAALPIYLINAHLSKNGRSCSVSWVPLIHLRKLKSVAPKISKVPAMAQASGVSPQSTQA